jgi:serine/threonine protein kinase
VVNKSPDWWVKLADFGVSKRVRGENTAYHTSLIGDYVAPEIFDLIDDEDLEDNFTYTTAVDMWSLGCLSYWASDYADAISWQKGPEALLQRQNAFPIPIAKRSKAR